MGWWHGGGSWRPFLLRYERRSVLLSSSRRTLASSRLRRFLLLEKVWAMAETLSGTIFIHKRRSQLFCGSRNLSEKSKRDTDPMNAFDIKRNSNQGLLRQVVFFAHAGLLLNSPLLRAHAQEAMLSSASLGYQTKVDYFKAFMASPPIITKLTWYKLARTDSSSGLVATNWVGTTRVSANGFIGRYQPACIFLKHVLNPQELNFDVLPGSEVEGSRGAVHWMVNTQGLTGYWEDTARFTAEIRIGPSIAFHSRTAELAELLNMGVMHMDPGTANWHGDRFTADAYIPEMKMPMSINGTLRATAEHLVKDMDVTYRSRIGEWHYVLRYTYEEKSTQHDMPSKIESFFVSDGEERKMAQWTILSLIRSPNHIDERLFALPKNCTTDRFRMFYYTNNGWYAKNAVGQLAPIAGGANKWGASDGTLTNRTSYYGAVLCSTIFAFASMWRAKIKSNTTNKTLINI
jgi:hypothetical protein